MVQLNESEKRALQIVLVFIAITFIVVGIIASVIKTRLAKEGEAIDAYMYPMVQYGVIKNPQEFRRYVFKRESRQFYIAMRWTLRAFFLLLIGYILYMVNFQDGNFALSSHILKDMFFDLEWPTVKIFGLRLISDWPTVIKQPQFHLTIEGYITYIMALGALGAFIKLMFVTLTFIGRLQRSSHVAFKSFSKNLESGVDIIQDE
jgi:hypothetical protein